MDVRLKSSNSVSVCSCFRITSSMISNSQAAVIAPSRQAKRIIQTWGKNNTKSHTSESLRVKNKRNTSRIKLL